MQKDCRIPHLRPAAAHLLYICLGLICLWLLGTTLYAGHVSADTAHRDQVFSLLCSAYFASVLAYGGAFLLDIELRHTMR